VDENEPPTGEVAQETPAQAETGPPARTVGARRRSRRDGAQPADVAGQPPLLQAIVEPSAAPATPVSPPPPGATVERSGDAVVIRFPSAAMPFTPRTTVPAATPPAARQGREPQPQIEPARLLPEAPTGNGQPRVAPLSGEEAEQERGGRRRRRRRRRRGRDGETPATAPPGAPVGAPATAASAASQRPASEPVEEAVTAEAVAARFDEPLEGEERRGRRRRRRRRRGGAVAPAAAAEVAVEAVTGEGPEPVTEEGGVELAERPPEEEEIAAAPAAVSGPRPRKEMIINVVPREECRIGILEAGKLEEIYLERASAENHVGNIYKGIVTNVEPSIQAAFVDFGLAKNGFLHISDLHPRYFPNGETHEEVGRKTPRRARPPIQRCLRRGQELLVQIIKEGIGTKGPTLTTYLSIPGRFMVMMPGMRQLGVSRKIEDDELRRTLRNQLAELDLPGDMGFIARTAAQDRTKKELQSDLNYLTRLWRAVEKRIQEERAPAELYRESDLVVRTIRDVYTSDIERIVVDDRDVAERAREFLAVFNPRARDTVVYYDDPQPIFHRYGIEAELERLHSRHVPLKSGGSLVIDQTEALVAIDVNSGKFRTEGDAETTAYKINIEAADEIARQLRLRDLGGVIVCDFIDMRAEKHRREVERRLTKNLKQHKERAKCLRMSQFGIIEMTRQRQRASLTRSVYQDCHHCRGTGLVKTVESVALDVMRLIQLAATREPIRAIEVAVSPEVAYLLQNRKRSLLHEMEVRHRRSISIRSEPSFGLDQVQIQCLDHRGRLLPSP